MLIDQQKRLAYDVQLKALQTDEENEIKSMIEDSVSVEYIFIKEGEEYIPPENEEDENEDKQ